MILLLEVQGDYSLMVTSIKALTSNPGRLAEIRPRFAVRVFAMSGQCLVVARRRIALRAPGWVAVKELKLSYQLRDI